MTKRVYHPTGNAWQDVPDAAVDAWAKGGWLKSKPKHVDDSEALPVGESSPAPDVPVDVVEPEPTPKGK